MFAFLNNLFSLITNTVIRSSSFKLFSKLVKISNEKNRSEQFFFQLRLCAKFTRCENSNSLSPLKRSRKGKTSGFLFFRLIILESVQCSLVSTCWVNNYSMLPVPEWSFPVRVSLTWKGNKSWNNGVTRLYIRQRWFHYILSAISSLELNIKKSIR